MKHRGMLHGQYVRSLHITTERGETERGERRDKRTVTSGTVCGMAGVWNGCVRVTHQANAPTRETNLSSDFDPVHERTEQNRTVPARKMFFSHFTFGLCLPLREKRPVSMMRTAGKSCRGIESRIAIES